MRGSAARSAALLALALLAALLTVLRVPRGTPAASAATPDGDLVLWHDLDEGATPLLADLAERFERLYPEVRVRLFAFDGDELPRAYAARERSGLAPDLVLVSNVTLQGALGSSVVDLEGLAALEHLKPLAIATVRDEVAIRGLPLTVETQLLYYDGARIEAPATDLVGLLEEVRAGRSLGLPTGFFDAAWGIGAFGGRVRDAAGRVVLNQGGFEAWLHWLMQVQEEPNAVLSPDREQLIDLFATGRLSYLVASSADLPRLEAALGPRVRAARLPRGPVGPAAPYLVTEVLALGPDAAPAQRASALAFAEFLAAPQQQRTLMLGLERVPSNVLVNIDRFALPSIHAARLQAFDTIPFRGDPLDRALVFGAGDDAYTQVLAGVLPPAEAAARLTELNRLAGLPVPPPLPTALPATVP